MTNNHKPASKVHAKRAHSPHYYAKRLRAKGIIEKHKQNISHIRGKATKDPKDFESHVSHLKRASTRLRQLANEAKNSEDKSIIMQVSGLYSEAAQSLKKHRPKK